MTKHRSGFTLIELLIAVAIIGIIAAILIPNLLDALQKSKQRATMAQMRSVGQAWFSWLTDEVSAAAAGSSQTFDCSTLAEALSPAELSAWLLEVNARGETNLRSLGRNLARVVKQFYTHVWGVAGRLAEAFVSARLVANKTR